MKKIKWKTEKRMFSKKDGEFEYRIPTKKEKRKIWIEEKFYSIIYFATIPFIKIYNTIIKIINWMLWEKICTGDNGIIGPGFHRYYTTKFAWGKLSFFILIILIILIVILLLK